MSQPSTRPTLYKGYRFPPEIISRCVWLYYGVGERLISLAPVGDRRSAGLVEGPRRTIAP